ncbi:MAG: hypothetical protein WC600_13070 [Desulfobaccales bacterium]
MIVDKSEIEDFNNAISSNGLEPFDFELTEREEPVNGLGVQPIIGEVRVRRKSSNVYRTYRAGHGSHWAADFVDDLTNGIFD